MNTTRRVLVIEDDPGIRTLIERLLMRAGLQVETACDGRIAIDQLERSEFHAIVLDLMMPEADGFEVLQYLSSSDRHAALCVIVCTAAGPMMIRGRSLDRADHLLTKPFDLSRLEELAATCTSH